MGVRPELIDAVTEMGWLLPRDIQDEAIPMILGGADVLFASETGTGKTGALALPIAQLIYEHFRGEARITEVEDKSSLELSLSGHPIVRLNPSDASPAVTLDDSCRVCQATQPGWHGVRANVGIAGTYQGTSPVKSASSSSTSAKTPSTKEMNTPTGKYYFEMIMTDDGLGRVGYAIARSSLVIGTDDMSWGFGSKGKKSHANQFSDLLTEYHKGDVIGVLLDFTTAASAYKPTATLSYSINGTFAVGFTNLPANVPLFPAVTVSKGQASVNFTGPYKHKPADAKSVSECPIEYTSVAVTEAAKAEQQQEILRRKSSSSSSSISTSSSSEMKDAAFATRKETVALILEPTRELAAQVYDQILIFTKYLTNPQLSVVLLAPQQGGPSPRKIVADARGANIVVGTPGMVESAIKDNVISLSQCRFFVLDEADALLEKSNRATIMNFHRQLPTTSPKVQVIICSATLHSVEVKQIAASLCVNPQVADLKGEMSVPENVDHVIFNVDPVADLFWYPKQWDVSKALQDERVHVFGPSARSLTAAATATTTTTTVASSSTSSTSTSAAESKSSSSGVSVGAAAYAQLDAAVAKLLHGNPKGLVTYTDEIHDRLQTNHLSPFQDQLSLGVKILKLRALAHLIYTLNPTQAIIFCRTQVDCDRVCKFLSALAGVTLPGHDTPTSSSSPSSSSSSSSSSSASSSKPADFVFPPAYKYVILNAGMLDREARLESFKAGETRFLISTDVAARGLDVKNLPLVINYTLPDIPETYIHRVGRTGRSGAVGMAVSIVAKGCSERVWWHTCSSKGRDNKCNQTDLTTSKRGGCTIHFDEPKYLKDIEARLVKIEIPRADLESLKDGMARVMSIAAKSRPAASRALQEQIQHISIIAPQANRLFSLETDAQKMYWSQRSNAVKWKQMLRDGTKATGNMADKDV